MTAAIVYYLIGALTALAVFVLTAEHFSRRSREIDTLIEDFNTEHPRRHLRVVRDEDAS